MGYFKFLTGGGNIYYDGFPGTDINQACRDFQDKYGAIALAKCESCDLSRYIKEYLSGHDAYGPATKLNLAQHLLMEAPGIDEDNAVEITNLVLEEMLSEGLLTIHRPGVNPSYSTYALA